MRSANDPNTFIGKDNQIADLLDAPIIRDAQDITWYAAGAENTWLCIKKTDGVADIEAFGYQLKSVGNHHEWVEAPMPLEEFRHCSLRPDPAADAQGLSEDLSKNHYAIGQLAIVCRDAWSRRDVAMHTATLALLEQHVPSVADLRNRAKTIESSDLKYTPNSFQHAVSQSLHELDALEALSDDPNGLATLDPWFLAQQLVRVASKVHRDSCIMGKPTLYTFESESEKSFLLVLSTSTYHCGTFNMWFDGNMHPLLVDYRSNGEVAWLDSPEHAWEWPRPYPGTLVGWNQAMASMEQVNAAPFDSLKKGCMRQLSPQETSAAILRWASNAQPMAAWNNVNNPSALVFLGEWAIQKWNEANPSSGQLLSSLLPPIDSERPPGQFDAWRQLVAADARTVEEKNEAYSIDNLNGIESHP